MSWRGKPVVVTGGMGFIGSNLVRRLLEAGAEVTVIDRMLAQYGANPFNLSGLALTELIEADIGAEAAIFEAVGKAAVIFNFAGQTSHMDSMKQPLEDLRLNQEANLRLLELVRRVNPQVRLIFSSTRQFYGPPRYLPVDEKHPIAAPDINGIHKYAAESYHMLYARVHGMRTTALRLTNVFGPRMRIRDAKQTFLGIWIRHVIENTRFEVWGDGRQLRDFVFVDDACSAFLLSADADEIPPGAVYNVAIRDLLSERWMLCRRTTPLPIEAVVRGYLSGSGWKAYRESTPDAEAKVDLWGVPLPAGLRESDRLPEPVFTPSTKAAAGHDEPMPRNQIASYIGDWAGPVENAALALYTTAAERARERGIIIADTKFEFGTIPDGNGGSRLLLIDEALTPDSSRFWPAATYEPGHGQPSFDKQFVRDYLESVPGWDKRPPAPDLPTEVVENTAEKYRDAYRRITGQELPG